MVVCQKVTTRFPSGSRETSLAQIGRITNPPMHFTEGPESILVKQLLDKLMIGIDAEVEQRMP